MAYEELEHPEVPGSTIHHGNFSQFIGLKFRPEDTDHGGFIWIVRAQTGGFVVFNRLGIEVLNIPERRPVLSVEIGHTSPMFG